MEPTLQDAVCREIGIGKGIVFSFVLDGVLVVVKTTDGRARFQRGRNGLIVYRLQIHPDSLLSEEEQAS